MTTSVSNLNCVNSASFVRDFIFGNDKTTMIVNPINVVKPFTTKCSEWDELKKDILKLNQVTKSPIQLVEEYTDKPLRMVEFKRIIPAIYNFYNLFGKYTYQIILSTGSDLRR